MRICLLNNLYPPVPSGSSHFTHDFAHRFAKRGHDVSVITVRHKPELPELETTDGVTVYRIPCKFLPQMRLAHNFRWMSYSYTPANLRRVEKFICERDIQLIHQNGHIFDLALTAARVKRRLKIPAVMHLHANALHNNLFYDKILEFGDRYFISRFIIRHFDELVVGDINLAEYAAARYGRTDSKIFPYGMDFPIEVEDLSREWIEKYELGSKRLIVSLGHIHENRNRCDLIRSMPHVIKKFSNILLLIIGEPYYKKPVELVKELKLEKHIVFTGALPRATAMSLMKAAEAHACWSNRSNAGLGIAALESMALGIPMVTTVREDLIPGSTLESGKHLIAVTNNDEDSIARALINVLEDSNLRKTIGRNGRDFVEKNFSWEAVCLKMETIFSSLIERNP